MSPAITILARTAKIVLGVVILASPPMRNALVGLDPGVPALLLLVAAAWAVVARLRPKATRSSELHLLRLLRRWGWLFAILLFVSPLLAHWSQQPTSRVAAFSAQLGHIPWFDARDHYEGALRVLTTGEFGAFNERRPANACWLAVLLAVAGWKLQMALLLQAALVGVLVGLACRAIAVRFGLAPSLAFFAVVLGLGRDYLPTPNTETLGIALSSLGVAILVLSRARKDPRVFALGLAASSMALAARPGPQFLIPALIGLGLYTFRGRPIRTAILLVLAGALGSAHGGALNALYGSGEGSMTAYPAYTLYGLTRASNYLAARSELESELPADASEGEIARVLYRRAFDNIRNDPGSFGLGLWQNLRKAIGKVPPNVARAVSPRWLLVPAAVRVDPERDEMVADKRATYPVLALALLGLAMRLASPIGRRERGLWLAVSLGIVSSVPFVFGDAGFRGLAVAYPWIALAIAVGLARPHRIASTNTTLAVEKQVLVFAGGAIAALLVLTTIGPVALRPLAPAPDLQAHPGDQPVFMLEHAPAVVVANRRVDAAGRDVIRRYEMLRWLDWAGAEQLDLLRGEPLPLALISAYDYRENRLRVLVGSHRVLKSGSRSVSLELQPFDEDGLVQRIKSWSGERPYFRSGALPRPVDSDAN